MASFNGGVYMINRIKSALPDKLFGKDIDLILVWMPLCGVVLFSLFLLNVVVVPKVGEVNDIFVQINKVENEIKLLNDKRNYLASLDQNELQSKSSLVENGVLSEKNSYLLIKVVSKIASNFGFSMGDFTVTLGDIKEIDKTSVKFDYQKVPVEVELTGPKSKFLEMVSEIENSLPVLSINSFNMTSNGDEATIKMNVSAYYLPNWNQTKLEKLSVTDLTPSKDEQGVLTKIGGYKYYGVVEGQIGGVKDTFKPSDRIDPFF